MSYHVLARKWRPQIFEELVGQEHVLRALVNALENERLHHAYLFTGTRGVGKTTIARILARALNCEVGISAKPCGECSACTEISEGRFIDLIEVDAASRTKVEDTRDLLENVQYKPTRGRFKIYLIDEVHMLSNHSFNALLKTLEEPPEHVKFLLATTDPQKLPVTVLSRCLQFNLKNLPAARISEYLELVLEKEKVPFEKNALGYIARAASGSMRDGLSLTDQAISHGGGKLAEQDVVEMLGTVDRNRIYQILDALVVSDGEALLGICEDLAQYSIDYFSLLEELLAVFHAIAVRQVVPNVEQTNLGDPAVITRIADEMTQEEVQLAYQMLLMGRKDLAASPDMHIGFEMLMLRLLAFQPETRTSKKNSSEVVQKIERSENSIEGGHSVQPAGLKEDVPVKKPDVAAISTPQRSGTTGIDQSEIASDNERAFTETKRSMDDQNLNRSVGDRAEIDDDKTPPPWVLGEGVEKDPSEDAMSAPDSSALTLKSEFTTEQQPEPDSRRQNPTDVSSSEVVGNDESRAPETFAELTKQNWISLFNALPLGGVVKSVTSHMVVRDLGVGRITFTLTTAGQPLFNPNHKQKLTDVFSTYFSEPIELDIELGGADIETPAENARRVHAEALASAEQSMLNDPMVKALMEEFQAELVPNSITFIDENTE